MKTTPRDAQFKTFISDKIRASHIATMVGGELLGREIFVDSFATFLADQKDSVSYQVGQPVKHQESQRVVICDRINSENLDVICKIVVEDPRESFNVLLSRLKPDFLKTSKIQFEELGFHSGASDIHKTAFIEDGVIIGKGCTIEPHVVIKRGTIIGQNTYVSANSVIGTHGPAVYKKSSETFSYVKFHYGTLQISNDVEIGSGCVLLKGMLGRTFIGARTVLGNLVHIGHGCEIGAHVWMAAGVIVCGHVSIDNNVSIGAGSVVRDNLQIGEGASLAMGSVVVTNVQSHTSVVGVPAIEKATKARSGPAL